MFSILPFFYSLFLPSFLLLFIHSIIHAFIYLFVFLPSLLSFYLIYPSTYLINLLITYYIFSLFICKPTPIKQRYVIIFIFNIHEYCYYCPYHGIKLKTCHTSRHYPDPEDIPALSMLLFMLFFIAAVIYVCPLWDTYIHTGIIIKKQNTLESMLLLL